MEGRVRDEGGWMTDERESKPILVDRVLGPLLGFLVCFEVMPGMTTAVVD